MSVCGPAPDECNDITSLPAHREAYQLTQGTPLCLATVLGACAGSQLPLAMPRSDARQNLIDSLTCATAFFTPPHVLLQEVAICFGGRLMRGNCAQKARTRAHS